MKNLITCFLLVLTVGITNATTYYVDSRVTTNGNGLSTGSPFNNYSSVPLSNGDVVLFARGSSYVGYKNISMSNVFFGAYGSGARPLFTAPADWVVFHITNSGVTIDNLEIGNATYAGIEIATANATVKYCSISNVQFGITIQSANTTITNNTISNTIVQVGPGVDDDAGAVAIKVEFGASNTMITYNTLINNIGNSPDYGVDGGAIEIWGNVNGVSVHHNYIEGNDGVFEVGGGNVQNVTFSYNIMKNNRGVGGIHFDGLFASTISNFNFINNTVYDTQGLSNQEMLWFNGNNGTSQVKIINNIFYYDGFIRFSGGANSVHQNNVYYSPNDINVGYPLHSSEQWGSPGFISNSNYLLNSSSIAVNTGQSYGFSMDYDGNPISGVPDVGAYEYQGSDRNLAEGVYRLKNESSGYYLNGTNVHWNHAESGTLNTIWSSQKWDIKLIYDDTYSLKCLWGDLNLTGNNQTDSVVQMGPNNGQSSQQWILEPVSGNKYKLKCVWGNKYMTGSNSNWDSVKNGNASNSNNTVWNLEFVSNSEDRSAPVNEILEADILIYPNSVSDYLYIQNLSTKYEYEKVSIYNLSGKEVMSFPIEVNQNEISISVDILKSGFYILDIQGRESSIQRKIIVK